MPRGMYPRLPVDERFNQQVDRSGDCHLWTGALNSIGYANFWFEGRYIGAHVYAWLRSQGPIPDGLVIRHKCRNRHCVRIDHLDIGTMGDNNRDRLRDGTQARGSASPRAKLTEDAVREARWLHDLGVPWERLARRYGVHGTTIARAVTHKRGEWKHVTD